MSAYRPVTMRLVTMRPLLLIPILLLFGACSGNKIVFNYPAEQVDFALNNLRTPAVFMDIVTDMRPLQQRRGSGHFLGINYPKDTSWDRDVTEIYAQALAEDLEQTHLVEVVPLRGQADYVLSADLLSLGCRFDRSLSSFLVPLALGGGAGLALGDDGSHRVKLGLAMGLVAVMAVPMPSHNRAEAEIRLTLKDRSGDIIWQQSCLGEYEKKVHASATSRQDQQYVDEQLTRAVKRANACLVGQMRQFMQEQGDSAR